MGGQQESQNPKSQTHSITPKNLGTNRFTSLYLQFTYSQIYDIFLYNNCEYCNFVWFLPYWHDKQDAREAQYGWSLDALGGALLIIGSEY